MALLIHFLKHENLKKLQKTYSVWPKSNQTFAKTHLKFRENVHYRAIRIEETECQIHLYLPYQLL